MPTRYIAVDYNNAYSRTNSRVMLHFLKRAQVSEKSAKLNRLYGRIQTAWQNVFVFVLTSCKQATLLQKGGHSLALCSKGLAIIIIFQRYELGNFFSQPDFCFFFFFFLLLCYIDVSAFVSLNKLFLRFYCERITFGLLVIHHPPPLPKII